MYTLLNFEESFAWGKAENLFFTIEIFSTFSVIHSCYFLAFEGTTKAVSLNLRLIKVDFATVLFASNDNSPCNNI